MGLFGRKNKNEEDMNDYGALRVVVTGCDLKQRNRIVVDCIVSSGRVKSGEKLLYKPEFGQETTVVVEKIEAMMMGLDYAVEGTTARFTLSGSFDMLDPTEGDYLTREY